MNEDEIAAHTRSLIEKSKRETPLYDEEIVLKNDYQPESVHRPSITQQEKEGDSNGDTSDSSVPGS